MDGIAAAATQMAAAKIEGQASIMVLKKSMDVMEDMAAQMVDQLLTLNVGSVQPGKVDISI